MKIKWLWMMSGMVLGLNVFTGCNDSKDSGSDVSSEILADQTVSIAAAGTHQTGILTAPAEGILRAKIKSAVGSDLKGSFVKVSDSTIHAEQTAADFTIATATTSGQTWRVKVFNPSGVAVDATIKVEFNP